CRLCRGIWAGTPVRGVSRTRERVALGVSTASAAPARNRDRHHLTGGGLRSYEPKSPWKATVDTRRVHARLASVMNVALTARHKHLVAEKVKNGAYGSATEVVREGLRLLEAQDERQRRIEWLQREVEKGF